MREHREEVERSNRRFEDANIHRESLLVPQSDFNFSPRTSPQPGNEMYSPTIPSHVTKAVHEKQRDHDEELISNRQAVKEALAILFRRLSRTCGESQVNEMLKVLCSEYCRIEDIRSSLSSVSSCEKVIQESYGQDFEGLGFSEHVVCDENGAKGLVYKRSAQAVIREQVGSCLRKDFFVSPSEARAGTMQMDPVIRFPSHPIAATLGVQACAIIRRSVMSNGSEEIQWNENGNHIQSAPVLLQIYSDKSHTTLKSSAFSFYPFHVVALNFTDDSKKFMINSGRTVLGYLPTKFDYGASDQSPNINVGLSRQSRIRIIHKCVDLLLEDLVNTQLTGFVSKTADGACLRLHCVVASYVADLPEAKDITAVLNGNQSFRNCHKCLTKTIHFSNSSSAPLRNLALTNRELSKYRNEIQSARRAEARKDRTTAANHKVAAQEILSKLSMENYPPAFSNHFKSLSSGLERVSILDPYAIFRFEPLHNLHLGITKMILRLIHLRLRSVSSMPLRVLHRMNLFLREVELFHMCPEMHVDFTVTSKNHYLNGLFNAEGVIGMLEAKNFKHVEKILPYLGTIADRAVSPPRSSTTSTLSTYCEILRLIYRRGCKDWWTSSELSELQALVSRFKHEAKTLFGKFHPSGLGTEKFHSLDHLSTDIACIGSIHHLSASIWEHSHCDFKKMYRSTSKRRSTALQTSVSRVEETMAMEKFASQSQILSSLPSWGKRLGLDKSTNKDSREKLVSNPSPCGTGNTFSASEIVRFVNYSEESGALERDILVSSPHIVDFYRDIGAEGFLMMAKELKILQTTEFHLSDPTRMRIRRPKSAIMTSLRSPSQNSQATINNDQHVHLTLTEGGNFIHRLVAARDYWNASGLRQDSVMMQTECCSCPPDSMCLWFGCMQCMLTIIIEHQTSDGVRNESHDFCFVRYLEVVKPRDCVDKACRSIKLRWARANDDVLPGHDPGKWYGLTPLTSVVGMISLVPAEGEDPYADVSSNRVNASTFNAHKAWYDKYYYLNQYYSPSECSYINSINSQDSL